MTALARKWSIDKFHIAHCLAFSGATGMPLAMILAARRLPMENIAKWVSQTGPLPFQREARDQLLGVAGRGMEEVKAYLEYQGLI